MNENAGYAVEPSPAERARRWAALPATVREKFEKLEAHARHLEAAQRGAWEAFQDANRAHKDATQRLARLEEESRYSRSKLEPRRVEDLETEIAHHAARRAPLEREHETIKARLTAALRLLAACKRHLGVER